MGNAVFDDGLPPQELLAQLKHGPAKHLKQHAYEYTRHIDAELVRTKNQNSLEKLIVCQGRSRRCRQTLQTRTNALARQAQIRRLKELQLRVVALIGTTLLSLLVGLANFVSRLLYDDMYGE